MYIIKSVDELNNLIISNNNFNYNFILELLNNYKGSDWIKIIKENNICNPDPKLNGYFKKLLFKNSNFEMYLIIWFPNALTPIHNHPNNGCFVKMLDGYLIEDIYENIGYQKAKFINSNLINKNDINYKESNFILHQIKNISSHNAVSLHIYLPPNFKYSIFQKI